MKADILPGLVLFGAIVFSALAPQGAQAKPFVVVHGRNPLGGIAGDAIALPDNTVLSAARLRVRAPSALSSDNGLLVFDVATRAYVFPGLCKLLVLDVLANPLVFDPGTRAFRRLRGSESLAAVLLGEGTFAFADDLPSGPCAGSIAGGPGPGPGPANRPPVANAGADRTIETTSATTVSVTLDGTGSSDPDGDAITHAWSGLFGTASTPAPTVDLAVDVVHTISLTVTDPAGASDTDIVVIAVTRVPAAAPACDIDRDGDIDRLDIGQILAARNLPASGPDDPRDVDGDGVITVLDARKCSVVCTLPRCAAS